MTEIREISAPSDSQRESSNLREVVIESKDNQRISSGGIRWKNVGLGVRVEPDCKVGVEVKLMGEWWSVESEGRREDDFVTTVVSETTTRRGLKQMVKYHDNKQVVFVRYH